MSNGGVWKWIAAILATALLAGAPGYVNLYARSPSREEVNLIRDRQDGVLQRLSAIDVLLANLDFSDRNLDAQIDELRVQIQELQRGG